MSNALLMMKLFSRRSPTPGTTTRTKYTPLATVPLHSSSDPTPVMLVSDPPHHCYHAYQADRHFDYHPCRSVLYCILV